MKSWNLANNFNPSGVRFHLQIISAHTAVYIIDDSKRYMCNIYKCNTQCTRPAAYNMTVLGNSVLQWFNKFSTNWALPGKGKQQTGDSLSKRKKKKSHSYFWISLVQLFSENEYIKDTLIENTDNIINTQYWFIHT